MDLKKHRIPALVTLLTLFLFIISSCDNDRITGPNYTPPDSRDTTGVENFKAENGLIIYFHKYGDGVEIAENDAIRVRYTGRKMNGDVFDSSYRNNSNAATTLQLSNVVFGFMQGLVGIIIDGERQHQAREGAIRTLVIPPALAYGNTSHQLSQDTLIFEIEVVNVVAQE